MSISYLSSTHFHLIPLSLYSNSGNTAKETNKIMMNLKCQTNLQSVLLTKNHLRFFKQRKMQFKTMRSVPRKQGTEIMRNAKALKQKDQLGCYPYSPRKYPGLLPLVLHPCNLILDPSMVYWRSQTDVGMRPIRSSAVPLPLARGKFSVSVSSLTEGQKHLTQRIE